VTGVAASTFKSTACEIRGAASYLNASKNSIEASHWINFPWATQRLRFGVPVAAVSVQIFLIARRALATNTQTAHSLITGFQAGVGAKNGHQPFQRLMVPSPCLCIRALAAGFTWFERHWIAKECWTRELQRLYLASSRSTPTKRAFTPK